MEAEVAGYRATAGPKGVPESDAITDYGAPGGKGRTKAREKAAAAKETPRAPLPLPPEEAPPLPP